MTEPSSSVPGPVQAAVSLCEHMVEASLGTLRLPGVSIGLQYAGRLVWCRGFGKQDLDSDTDAAGDTVYRVASISKAFTVTALMRMRDDGLVALDDPITRLVPEAAQITSRFHQGDVRPPTLRQLASHTGGLACEGDIDRFGSDADFPPEQVVLASLPRVEMVHKPGLRWHYSGIGYALLGLALSRACGEPVVEYIARHVLAPLKMHTSSYNEPDTYAVGYLRSQDTRPLSRAPRARYSHVYAPTGGLYSSVPDLAKWAQMHLDAERTDASAPSEAAAVLHPASVREQHAPHAFTGATSRMRALYGLGWFIGAREADAGDVQRDKRCISHPGVTWGHVSNLVLLPHMDAALIVLCNAAEAGGVMKLCDRLLDTLVPAIDVARAGARAAASSQVASTRTARFAAAPERVARLVLGRYERESEQVALDIRWVEQALVLHAHTRTGYPGPGAVRLRLATGQHGDRDAEYRVVGTGVAGEKAWFVWHDTEDRVVAFRYAHERYLRADVV